MFTKALHEEIKSPDCIFGGKFTIPHTALEEEHTKRNMKMNTGKQDGKKIEQAEHFKYLATITEENERIRRELNIFNTMKKTFLEKTKVSTKIKTQIVKKWFDQQFP